MASRSQDDTSGLKQLKAGHSYLAAEGPSRDILECFENRFPASRYMVTLTFPDEFCLDFVGRNNITNRLATAIRPFSIYELGAKTIGGTPVTRWLKFHNSEA